MKRLVWCAWVLVLAAGTVPRAAYGELAGCDLPKVDNFVVFVDQSGSMYQKHAEVGEVKELLVKRTLLELNEDVPKKFCCLNSSEYLFAPFETVKESYVYDHDSMATRIGWIPDSQPVAVRLTPMASGFDDLTRP
jgi:OOP family OmpA-OmpF porin